MREKGNKMKFKTSRSESHPKDEIYQVNGIAYLECDMKLAHLRILMAIIKHLQNAIHYKISRGKRHASIPSAYLPKFVVRMGEITPFSIWNQYGSNLIFGTNTISMYLKMIGISIMGAGIGVGALWKNT